MTDKYKDKYFSVLGDSISTYEGYLPEGYPSYYSYGDSRVTGILGFRDTWWGQLIRRLGAKLLVNNSWSGSLVCRTEQSEIESYGCSDARTGGLGADGILPDVIIVFMGTNDRGRGLPAESEDKTDLSVLENAYGVMLDKLKRNYPRAEIWCCTLPKTTCSRDPYFEFPRICAGKPTESWGELIARTASARGCRVIDLWDEEKLCDTIDHLHPNYLGMTLIADMAEAAMTRESKA